MLDKVSLITDAMWNTAWVRRSGMLCSNIKELVVQTRSCPSDLICPLQNCWEYNMHPASLVYDYEHEALWHSSKQTLTLVLWCSFLTTAFS